ncbi:elongin A, like [Cololabis saira]|uniref:elongin A, like n=1 Tax=Cololabis saira TaxID=129043 RepID=UPI002AD22854|nr:elongin A, like [Cololabis saira]
MASSSQVVKRIMRCKLQLSDTAEPTTDCGGGCVEDPIHSSCSKCSISNCGEPKPGIPYLIIKTLQKLKDLDVTLDILAETGIGKIVNSLRRDKHAGEYAKSLVKGWKKLVAKKSTSSHAEVLSETTVKNKDDESSSEDGSLPAEDVNGNRLTSPSKNQDSSDEAPFKTQRKKADLQKGKCERKIKTGENKKCEKSKREIHRNNTTKNKIEIKGDKMDLDASRKNKNSKALLGDKHLEGTSQKSRLDSREKLKVTSESRGFWSDRESNRKSKPSKESTLNGKESFSSSRNPKEMSKVAKDDRSLGISRSSENRKRKKTEEKPKPDSEGSKHKDKKAKIKPKKEEGSSHQEEPSMSFESYLNYDASLKKRKCQPAVKKTHKTMKTAAKRQPKNDSSMKSVKSPASSPEQTIQDSIEHLMNVPLPATLPELEKPSSVDYYFNNQVEKEPDFADISEESAVFTGQRLNKKMQVYSGAKTLYLPTMMSLYQQCIRTLQNNIDLLYETGGVPFELLEPVLERCTPEQLLRIEECNPIYIGVSDHLWGKHCQRDFKGFKLKEYESWKELYLRMSEERERKLQRLTKTIVSANSKKPKGRQVMMAFIHTVAKPPRDVRIQQEIHGTAVQQPHQPKCSVKTQDNRLKPSCNESSSTGSGPSNTQDPRKRTRVAPMMAKSLKAFKKQLGRR